MPFEINSLIGFGSDVSDVVRTLGVIKIFESKAGGILLQRFKSSLLVKVPFGDIAR